VLLVVWVVGLCGWGGAATRGGWGGTGLGVEEIIGVMQLLKNTEVAKKRERG